MGSSCVSIQFFVQGGYNSIYSLAFENGTEAIARIPHKFVKEPHLLIASEVATMDFLRQEVGLPIPRVYRWSRADETNNEAPTEYIIMEKMPGVNMEETIRMGNHVPEAIYAELVEMQLRLADIRFSSIGSLFYKEDIHLPYDPLYSTSDSSDDLSEKFCIGPSVHSVFRRLGAVGRGTANAGPWKAANSYWHAVLDSEHAIIPGYRTSDHPRTPGDGLYDETALSRMLDFYRHAVDQLCPPPPYEQRFCVWHPDLYPRNILFDPASERITGLLDWQGAIVAPLFYQVEAKPGCFRDPKPSDSEEPKSELKALCKTLTQGTVIDEVLAHPLYPFAINPLSLFLASKGFNLARCREQWIVNWYLLWTPDDDAPEAQTRPESLLPYEEVDSQQDIAGVQAWKTGQEVKAQILAHLGVDQDGECEEQEYEEKKKMVAAVHAQYLAEGGDPDWWPFDS